MLINVKMPTFLSRINFMLSRVEHKKGFITLRPDLKIVLHVLSFGIVLEHCKTPCVKISGATCF